VVPSVVKAESILPVGPRKPGSTSKGVGVNTHAVTTRAVEDEVQNVRPVESGSIPKTGGSTKRGRKKHKRSPRADTESAGAVLPSPEPCLEALPVLCGGAESERVGEQPVRTYADAVKGD
jgi:hypothetical protein